MFLKSCGDIRRQTKKAYKEKTIGRPRVGIQMRRFILA
jgi:hypothetical protein